MKREFNHFAPWDAKGMAAHLEAMEAKGWRFRGTDWLGRWQYEECQSQAVRYAVTYVRTRPNWRISPTEQEQDLEDICFDAGWRKLEVLSRFHIYRNEDPHATDLETDELTRLDALDRALRLSITSSAVIWSIIGAVLLLLTPSLLIDDLPSTLATGTIPGALGILLGPMLLALLQFCSFRRWRRAARNAAQAGLPCPEVKIGRAHTRWYILPAALSMLLMLTCASLIWFLGYAIVLLCITILRWWLQKNKEDEYLADRILRAALIAACVILFAINCIDDHLSSDPHVESLPLSAQDLVDTTGMELRQFDLNGSDSIMASYHDYWQPDNRSVFYLRYSVFDLRLPFLEESCRDWYRADFEAIAARSESTPESADPVPWNAEEVHRAGNHWLLFYEDRIVSFYSNLDLTPEQIAVAAEKLAP